MQFSFGSIDLCSFQCSFAGIYTLRLILQNQMGKHIYIASIRNCGREELTRRYAKEKGNSNIVCINSGETPLKWAESYEKAKIDENTIFVWNSLEQTHKDFSWQFKKIVQRYPKNDFIVLSSCRQQRFSKKIQDLLKFYHFEYYYFPDPVTFPAKDRDWLIQHMLKNIGVITENYH